MNYYLLAFKKYSIFNGRSQRAEYWYFVLFNFIIAFVLGFVDEMLGTTSYTWSNYGILGGLFWLITLIPGITVGVRRLHDIGKSGWMLLISLIPLIGWVRLIVLMATDSNPWENEYGPNPKI